MLRETKTKGVFAVIFALSLLVAPGLSYADRGSRHDDRHYYRYRDRPHFGLRVSFIPDGYFSLRLRGSNYFYYDGLYYSRYGGDYVIVNPPVGAVVTKIPQDFQPVVINDITYYVDNGIYYVYKPHGYQVVPRPLAVVPQAPAAVVSQPASVSSDLGESFTVNVPNDKGGFTPVALQESGNGFIGPQGEYYATFPKVKQLKTMYGK